MRPKLHTPVWSVLIVVLILLLLGNLGPATSLVLPQNSMGQAGMANPPKVKWVYPFNPGGNQDTALRTFSSPALGSDGTIYVTGSCLFALNPQGTLKWKSTPVEGDCLADEAPVVDPQGDIYGRAGALSLTGFFATHPDGSLKWTSQVLALPVFISPVASDGRGALYAVSNTEIGQLAAISAHDGSALWGPLKMMDYVQSKSFHFSGLSSPVIRPDGRILVILSLIGVGEAQGTTVLRSSVFKSFTFRPDGSLERAVDAKPSKISSFFSHSYSPALAGDGTVYLVAWDQDVAKNLTGSSLYAIDPEGKIDWVYSAEGQAIATEPVLGLDGTIYWGTTAGQPSGFDSYWSSFYAIRPNGKLAWVFHPAKYETIEGTPAVGADGVIYLPTERFGVATEHKVQADQYGGTLYALSPEGKVLWSFSATGDIKSSPTLAPDGAIYFVTVGPCDEQKCEGRVYALQTSSPGLANSPWPMYRHDPQHTGRAGPSLP